MKHWNNRFQGEEYFYGKEPNVFLKRFQEKINISGNVLAIAEGEGRNAVYLAEQGINVTTWDQSENGLAKTQKLASARGVEVTTKLVELDEAQWDHHKWDAIVCVFGHFPSLLRQKTLKGVKQAIKPGGFYMTEVYSPYQIPYKSGGPQNADFLYKPDELLNAFKDWRIVHFFMGEVFRHEGKGHNGLSHVIQLVAQKPNL